MSTAKTETDQPNNEPARVRWTARQVPQTPEEQVQWEADMAEHPRCALCGQPQDGTADCDHGA